MTFKDIYAIRTTFVKDVEVASSKLQVILNSLFLSTSVYFYQFDFYAKNNHTYYVVFQIIIRYKLGPWYFGLSKSLLSAGAWRYITSKILVKKTRVIEKIIYSP